MVAHPVSQTSFTQNHASYDQFRPGYPEEALKKVVEVTKVTPDSTIVEIGAGTGKFTALLAKETKAKIISTDPSPGMLETFRKNLPDIEAIQADASKVPLADGSADAIVIAQAFHWFANEDSVKEFHRLLKPAGVLCLIWNYEDFDSLSEDNWQYKTVKLCHSYDKNVPQYNHMKWPAAFEGNNYFGPMHEAKFPYDKVIPSKQFYWDYWKTRSYLTALGDKLADFKVEFEKTLEDSLKLGDVKPNGELVAKRGTHIVWLVRD